MASDMTSLLSDDVLEHILQCLTDFRTLRAAVLVSKRFYETYSEHPRTITRRVAWNVAGPALPQAIRLVRHPVVADDDDDSDDDDDEERSVPFDFHVDASVETTDGPPLTVQEQEQLSVFAECASKLEDIFSFRYKDRSSKQSKLNSLESWRFRRAVFRLNLYSRIFNLSMYRPANLEFDDDEQVEAKHQKDLSAKKAFLVDFLTEELVELYAVSHFLLDLADWASYCGTGYVDSLMQCRDMTLAVGPHRILEAYETGSFTPILDQADEDMDGDLISDAEERFLEGYLSVPLTSIWERRKVTPPKLPTELDSTIWYSILENVQEHDTCTLCNHAKGINIWNESNWDYLQGLPAFNIVNLHRLLMGRLRDTYHITNRLHTECSKLAVPSTSRFLSRLIGQMFSLKTPEYDAWQNIFDLICTECLQQFMASHLHLWLLATMRAAGDPVQDDCWYGYSCRTQVHNSTHATKLNHLCPQTRF
ncbi:hypothetical protein BDZ89DRAFT_1064999 [Hymenopellis radicata]|nr:hypothetical protein BDZ89DRAFT_1064999 [Hymenopellis radicata]